MGRQPYLRFFNVSVKLPTFNFHLCFNMQFDNMHVLTLELSPRKDKSTLGRAFNSPRGMLIVP